MESIIIVLLDKNNSTGHFLLNQLLVKMNALRSSKKENYNYLYETADYIFKILDRDHRKERAMVLGSIFSQSEPLFRHLGGNTGDYEKIWASSIYKNLSYGDNSIIIAECKKRNEIAGMCLAGDLYYQCSKKWFLMLECYFIKLIGKYPKAGLWLMGWFSSNALPMATMRAFDIEMVDKWLNHYCPKHLNPQKRKEEVLIMEGVAVKKAYRGKGLELKMTELIHQVAIVRGFKVTLARCYGDNLKSIFKSLGYQLLFETKYDKWKCAQQYLLKEELKENSKEREYCTGFYSFDLK